MSPLRPLTYGLFSLPQGRIGKFLLQTITIFCKILFRGEITLYFRKNTDGIMPLGPLYLKYLATLSRGSARNGVKRVPRLLSLKLVSFELESINFQAVFFSNTLSSMSKYGDKKISKKSQEASKSLD